MSKRSASGSVTTRSASQSHNKKPPRFAFAIDTKTIPSIPTNKGPDTISKLFWSKFRPQTSLPCLKTASLSAVDNRSFMQLMNLEVKSSAYRLQCFQNLTTGAILTNYASQETAPWMRQKCFQWLLGISEARDADPNVVFHAMSLFDSLLIRKPLPNDNLQLCAGASYLLASKLRETCPVNPSEMQMYTEEAFSESDFKQFELFMSMELDWNLDCVTPIPFLQTLASCLVCPDLVGVMVEKSTAVLLKCVASEHLCAVRPSLLAGATLLYTMTDLASPEQANYVHRVCSQTVVGILGVNLEVLLEVTNTVTNMVSVVAGDSENDQQHPCNITPPKSVTNETALITTPSAPHDLQFVL